MSREDPSKKKRTHQKGGQKPSRDEGGKYHRPGSQKREKGTEKGDPGKGNLRDLSINPRP